MAETCAGCRFFLTVGNGAVCRRNPPTGQYMLVPGDGGRPMMQFMPIWPQVRADQWCGEFRRGLMLPTPIDERMFGEAAGQG